MELHPVLREKLVSGLEPVQLVGVTRRDARLPAIQNKVHTVLGMRRVGKTTFLRQVQSEKQSALSPTALCTLVSTMTAWQTFHSPS
jgi:hypothetical protein